MDSYLARVRLPTELVLASVAPTMVAIQIDREVTVMVPAEYSTTVSMKMSCVDPWLPS